jgi:hypothetical protein
MIDPLSASLISSLNIRVFLIAVRAAKINVEGGLQYGTASQPVCLLQRGYGFEGLVQ